ncbi:hypothetical protein SEA_MADI_34 [Gordonia phage Madi]|uniref:Uncharacterized protein n=1 Tax=Gordonia phage Sienna TaxID=2759396 RepID=A0A7L7STZ3_9CAUD|nr:hypothetical protein SEA_SIENNA_34 [Gordonia phage Sienna]QYW00837.1 hypothetical protein SEA_MADI_34 [Gordonia phage Madi]
MSNTTASVTVAAAQEAARPKADVFIAPKGFKADKDWSYIADKDPLETHHLFAQIIRREAGIEISAKQVQALLLMHRWMQASDLNRERETFRGRTLGSVIRGSETLLGRTEDRATIEGEDAQVVQTVNSVSDEVAEAIRAELAAPVAEESEQEPEVDFRTAPKAALVSMVVEQELAPEADAKKLTVKKLRALLSGEEA